MVCFLAILLGAVVFQAVTLADTAGPELTPAGAERAGSAAGTIPVWDGGISSGSAAVTRRGNYTLILKGEEWAIPYAVPGNGAADAGYPNLLLAFMNQAFPACYPGAG